VSFSDAICGDPGQNAPARDGRRFEGAPEEFVKDRTILMVAHSEWRERRLAPLLSARGYQLEWRCPAKGSHLPDEIDSYAGAVVFGGVHSANDAESVDFIRHEIDWIGRFVDAGKHYLGICLGGQLLARALGARVASHPEGRVEIGYYPIVPTEAGRDLFPERLHVYQWHREGFELPGGAELLARGEAFPHQAYRYGEHAFGLQFHPEVTGEDARSWMGEVPDHAERPGAQSLAEHAAGIARYDPGLHDWLAGFLDRWLATGAGARESAVGQEAPSAVRRRQG
jgi:GMP synthase (glutamine-hydrolysing)